MSHLATFWKRVVAESLQSATRPQDLPYRFVRITKLQEAVRRIESLIFFRATAAHYVEPPSATTFPTKLVEVGCTKSEILGGMELLRKEFIRRLLDELTSQGTERTTSAFSSHSAMDFFASFEHHAQLFKENWPYLLASQPRALIIAGFGDLGPRLLEIAISQGYPMEIYVLDTDRKALRRNFELIGTAGAQFGGYEELREFRRQLHGMPTTSYICTPPDTHLAVYKRLIELSDVVAIEKPLEATSDAAEQLSDLADVHSADKVTLGVDHYLAKWATIALDVAARGGLTEVLREVEIDILETGGIPDARLPALKGGIVLDLLPHALAILVRLLGNLDKLEFREGDRYRYRGCHLPAGAETYAQINLCSITEASDEVPIRIRLGKGVDDLGTARGYDLKEVRVETTKTVSCFDVDTNTVRHGESGSDHTPLRPRGRVHVDIAYSTVMRNLIEGDFWPFLSPAEASAIVSKTDSLLEELREKPPGSYKKGSAPTAP